MIRPLREAKMHSLMMAGLIMAQGNESISTESQAAIWIAAIGAVASVVVTWINKKRVDRVDRKVVESSVANSLDHGQVMEIVKRVEWALGELHKDVREVRSDLGKVRTDVRKVDSELVEHVEWELNQKYMSRSEIERLVAEQKKG